MDYRRLKPYHGLLLFAAVLVSLIFIATPLQMKFGISGVAMTELMLLALTAAAFLITRPLFKQTFPLRLPPVREFFGGAFVYAGVYLLMIPPLLLTQYFFPQLTEVADSLAELGTSVSPMLAVLIIAVMPAICEETLHRGFILSSLKPIKSVAAIVLLNGLIFGIFHLDPYRFIPTMMLGCAFAYIALKTDSIVLTMLFHFINNLLSVISMFTAQTSYETVQDTADIYSSLKLATIIGVGLIYTAIGFVLLFIGVCMLNRRSPRTTTTAAVVIGAIVFAVAGTITAASTSIATVMDMSGTFSTEHTDGSISFPLELDRDGIYAFSITALCQDTGITFTLEKAETGSDETDAGNTTSEQADIIQTSDTADSSQAADSTGGPVTDGDTAGTSPVDIDRLVFTQSADNTLILSQTIELDAGSYTMRITLDPEREGVYQDVTAQIMVLRLMG